MCLFIQNLLEASYNPYDTVGSTTKLIEASRTSDKKYIIVATEKGILHQMKKYSNDKIFLEAPTEGEGASKNSNCNQG